MHISTLPQSRTYELFLAASILFGLVGLAACGGTVPEGVVIGDGDGFEIEVNSRGDTVTYEWQGGAARFLEVENLDAQEVVWRIVARQSSEGGFSPPVDHRRSPAAATEEVAPSVVVTGERHEVTIELLDGTSGAEAFTP